MKNFTLDVGADGVAVARFDVPGRSMNTITYAVQDDLGELAQTIAADASIIGLVLLSSKPSGFCAGADLVEMEGAIAEWRRAGSQDELRAGVESAGRFSQRLRALEIAGKPTAVVLHGVALGGGLELALAAHHRIATGDAAKLRLGLPEVTIGLMPGAGATQRLPRLMGLERSTPYLIEGKPIDLETAVQTGVIHAHVEEPAEALATATRWVLDHRDATQPWDVKGYRFAGGPHTPAGYAKFPLFVAHAVGDGPGDHAARANILRAVYEGSIVPIDAGLRIESRYFFNTVRAPSSGAMVRTLFHARQSLAKAERGDAEPYAERLRGAWADTVRALIAEGEPERFVLGVSRSLSPRLTPSGTSLASVSLHPTDDRHVDAVRHRILWASAIEARASLDEGIVTSREEADLRALDVGYPAFTGGPISFLEHGPHAQASADEPSSVPLSN